MLFGFIISLVMPTVTHAGATYSPGNYFGKSVQLLNFNTSLVEPNLPDYVNYCGPASSRVLISAWTKNVPSLDTLAAQEKTDPVSGTRAVNMVGPINRAIGNNYYRVTHAQTQGALSNLIGGSIAVHHRPLIVGLKTQPPSSHVPSLDGWTHSVSHFVMVYGFDFRSADTGYIYYFEIGSRLSAGTATAGKKKINYRDFWTLASMYDVQLTGPSS
ncbi:MAG: hypothetical protein ACJ8H8_04705 [Geminicoccaceae bacterium]